MKYIKLKIVISVVIIWNILIFSYLYVQEPKDNSSDYKKLIEVLIAADKYNNTDIGIVDVEYKNITYYIFTESQINLIGEKGGFEIETQTD